MTNKIQKQSNKRSCLINFKTSLIEALSPAGGGWGWTVKGEFY